MIKVYICEDNSEQLRNIRETVSGAIAIENYDMVIEKATKNPMELLETLKANSGTGIYFLDVDLGCEINGIQLGEMIRQLDPAGFIIFITTHAEMTHLTFKYKVEALDFIVKDNFKDVSARVRECLEYAHDKYQSLNGQRNEVFHIHTNDKVILAEYKQIIAFETSSTVHKVIMHSDKRQVEFYGSIKEIEMQLDKRFVRCHQSYIVNREKIKEIDKANKVVRMLNGQECMISVRGMRLLKEK